MVNKEYKFKLSELDEKFRETEIGICEICKKKIKFWQRRAWAITGEYHHKCFYKLKEKPNDK